MDKEIVSLRDAVATIKSSEKLLKASLITANATITAEDLRAGITVLHMKKAELEGRLQPLRSGSVQPIEKEERERVEKEWAYWTRRAGTRKKICMDLWGYCTDLVPEAQTKEDLWVSYLSQGLIGYSC